MTLRETLASYRSPRVWLMTLMGFSAGLPYLLTGSTLSAWLTDAGVELATIGFLTWTRLSYTWKFLWSPLLDRYQAPIFGFLGRRRGWIVLIQLAISAVLVSLALNGPNLPLLTVLVLLLAFLSASQDIVLDAWRTDLLPPAERSTGTATFIMGYRLGLLVAGMVALVLSDQIGWASTYLVMAACMGLGVVVTLAAPEPEAAERPETLFNAVVEPFAEFFSRKDGVFKALGVLLFLTLYRLGDVAAAAMSVPFLKDVGFSNTEIGVVGKFITFAASVAGGLLGGGLIVYFGLFRALVVFGIGQAATNVCYVLLATGGKSMGVMVGGMILDQVAGGLATTAGATLIMGLCDRRYTAVQFALLTSAAGLAGHFLSGWTGLIAERFGWAWFYGLTMLAVVPALMLLSLLGDLVGRAAAATAAHAGARAEVG